MMTKRQIYFWHGQSSKIEKVIAAFCTKEDDDRYYWYGTLDEFEIAYGRNFIVFPGQICVTEHNSFGQR